MERQKLRSARLAKYWTLAEAAEQIEVDVNTLSRWELGKTKPHGYNIVRLCEVYEKTPAELDLESKQEMVDAVEQFRVLSASAPLLRESEGAEADEQEGQAQVSGKESSSLTPSPPSTSLPLIASVLLPKYPPRRSWKRKRGILLIALMAFLIVSGSTWYAIAHSLASTPGQRPPFSLAVGQGTLTTTAQERTITTSTGKTPTAPGTTPTGKTPTAPAPTPTQRTPVSPSSTPPVSPVTPTKVPQPASTPTKAQPTSTPTKAPTPAMDCLRGSASHLAFSSLLGLGNTSPSIATITNCGGPAENWFASVETSSGGDWLSANPATGTIVANGSENVQIQAAGSGLQIGTYQGSVTFSKGSAQWTITVTFTIVQV